MQPPVAPNQGKAKSIATIAFLDNVMVALQQRQDIPHHLTIFRYDVRLQPIEQVIEP
jgi:hypothetical protein